MKIWSLVLWGGLTACHSTGEVMVQPYQNALNPVEPTVVNRQLMDEQNATTLSDALKNVPSVTR
jgi:outer membrane receptor for monomeric catechols